MNELTSGEHDLLSRLRPDSPLGALVYLVLFIVLALVLSRGLRAAVHAAMSRQAHIDRTTISFAQQFGSGCIWVVMLILYAHLIPVLRAMGTALLAGASIASVIIGLAAQSTLGNLVAGIAMTIYRPFRLGDTLQLAAPTGTEIGTVEMISLGYTTMRTPDGRLVVLPNSIAASQVLINLSRTFTPGQMSISIRVSRDADLDAACKLAIEVAAESVGREAVAGCFLMRMEATLAVLELRFRVPDLGKRDTLRSTLVARLAQRFAQAQLAASASEPAGFA
ncbi:MAG TPA: mechanosensitive ion channel family protein [Steroidobacteraceae bacterium]|jgi:small-conductance mechanosensitive channel